MRFGRFTLACALAALFSFGMGQQTPPSTSSTEAKKPELSKEQKDEVLKALERVMTERAFVPGIDLKKWPEFLEKQREAIDKAETDAEFSRAVNNALRSFGISHCRLLAPRAAEARTRTSVIGVGLSARAENNTLVVTAVVPNGPAEKAGIKAGNVITLLDGKAPADAAALNGEVDTEVTVKVKDEKGDERELKLKRERISTLRPDTLTWPEADTAVLKIHSFSRGYNRENIEKLMQEAAKAKHLILDLRGNGGGAVNNLQHLLSLLLPPDTVIGTFVSRTVSNGFAEAKPEEKSADVVSIAKWTSNKYKTREVRTVAPFKGKIAVLIDRRSASASEIAAMALRENAGAPVIGTRSAGAVLASIFGRLPHRYEIQYPVSDYVTKNYVRIEANPVIPDIEATNRAEDGKDPGVDAALKKLREAAFFLGAA